MRFSWTLLAPALVVAGSAASRPARADNVSEAADELKQGYALKQAGDCRDAIAHLARSVQLDPTPKALLNRADCEAQTGDLVAAQGHAAEGRRMAHQQNSPALESVADQQLAALEKRLPRLTIQLAPGAPAGCAVSRDGAPLDGTLLGAAVGLNPGAHWVEVSAPGYAPRRFDVTLAEGVIEQLEVEPGAKLHATVLPPAAATPEPLTAAAPNGARTRSLLEYSALGVGAAGLVVGVATGIAAGSKHGTLVDECSGNLCPPDAQGNIDSFHALRTLSTIGYVVGLAGLAGGAVLWFTAPASRPSSASAQVWIGPASAGVGGRF